MDVSVNHMKDDVEVSIHLNNVVKIELKDGKIVETTQLPPNRWIYPIKSRDLKRKMKS